MTLRELFNLLDDPQNGAMVLSFFILVPIACLLLGFIAKNEGHLTPWKYIYAGIIYLICIPGIFAVTLDVYLFLFEKQSIMDTNIYTQILPILSMVISLLIIKSNVDLDWIPGFNKLNGLLFILGATLSFMWIIDRTRIWVISYLRFEYVLLIFILLLLIIRMGWYRMMGSKA